MISSNGFKSHAPLLFLSPTSTWVSSRLHKHCLKTVMTEIPFEITIADEQIDLLKQKLALTVFPDELDDAGWDYGVPLADMQRLITRWKNGYDWKKQEAQLNKELPQYTRDISIERHGNLNIHYIHKKSDVADAIPLLFVHGCTSTFIANLTTLMGSSRHFRARKFY